MATNSNDTAAPIDFRRFGRLAYVYCKQRE